MTAEQLEAARAERMRQNGPGAITIEDVRTWIEETGLCTFLPRSAQAGHSILAAPTATPTFVEAVAGQRIAEPNPELMATAESLLVCLEAEGVAVRLNLSGQPINQAGDQPDYVVASWVLPYIYALRGDRDWRRSPQLTGSRQVSQLAVQAAKHIDTANLTSTQIRDALGREVTEAAVLRALHELWKQLRIIPVVPQAGDAALWQPLRQRFQKAIAEGASTSQVTAISVLASIYLQAVIAASMEDIEMFLSPLTSRSKIREVVRGLAATRQVHSTNMGHSAMFYVAGTLPEFPAVPSFEIGASSPAFRSSNHRGSTYLNSYLALAREEEAFELVAESSSQLSAEPGELEFAAASADYAGKPSSGASKRRPMARSASGTSSFGKAQPSGKTPSSGKSGSPRPRTSRNSSPAHPRERSRGAVSEPRPSLNGDRRRAPMPRGGGANANGSRSASNSSRPAFHAGPSNGNGNGSHTPNRSKGNFSAGNGQNGNGGRPASRPETRSEVQDGAHASSRNGVPSGGQKANGGFGTRPDSRLRASGKSREPVSGAAAKRYSFSGQQKQAPKPVSKAKPGLVSKPASKPAAKNSAAAQRLSQGPERGPEQVSDRGPVRRSLHAPAQSAQAKHHG